MSSTTTIPQSPRWLPWLVGPRDEEEVVEDIAMAYRGAEAGGFLPEEAGMLQVVAPPCLQITGNIRDSGACWSWGSPQNHPHFGGVALRRGRLPAALRGLAPQRLHGIWVHWNPGAGMALAFWSLLFFQMAAEIALRSRRSLVPGAWRSSLGPATNSATSTSSCKADRCWPAPGSSFPSGGTSPGSSDSACKFFSGPPRCPPSG